MTTRMTRRDALVGLGVVGAATVLRIDADAQGQDLLVAAQPAELRISSVSPATVRVSVFPRGTAIDQLNADNALIGSADGRRVSAAAAKVKAGDLSISVSQAPLTVVVSDASGAVVQKLTIPEAGGRWPCP